jgi:hypothetical protein
MKLYKNFFCEICKKNRGKHFDHSECSKKLQELHENVKTKKAPKRYSEKHLDYFLKF